MIDFDTQGVFVNQQGLLGDWFDVKEFIQKFVMEPQHHVGSSLNDNLSKYAVVEALRREKFGLIGDLCTPNPLAKDLQNSVDQLSKGLYSKHTHFVMELIQNAEDNEYGT